MIFNAKSENLHETLRFKAKKVTPNQLFHGKSLFAKSLTFKRKSWILPQKCKKLTFWVESAKFLEITPKGAKKRQELLLSGGRGRQGTPFC